MRNLFAAFLFLVTAISAHADRSVGSNATFTFTSPLIDGVIEEIWQPGLVPTQFRQIRPALFQPSSIETEVFFLYNTSTVYLAARLAQPKSSVQANQGKRDAAVIMEGDYITFALDPLNNGNTAYYITVNPANGVVDGVLDASGFWDPQWDGIFRSAVHVGDNAWSVELEIPLSSIGFQNAEEQEWGFQAIRFISQSQELAVARLVDQHQPFRITDFTRLTNLTGLVRQHGFVVAPYLSTSSESDLLLNTSTGRLKSGADVKIYPSPSMTVLATVNPDYAQVESDREIINVGDVPDSYPEKRPFFTESSDMFPGLAVNTRNILDIQAGVKLRQVMNRLKYDVTSILDGENHLWLLGNGRWTDNESYHVELISGMKKQPEQTHFNVTTNFRTWLFDKQLAASTWFGTINSRHRNGVEFESYNSVRWITRTLYAGLWGHFKSEYFNPNTLGHHTLSNEIFLATGFSYSFINATGFWRVINPEFKIERSSLFTDPTQASVVPRATMKLALHPDDYLGDWNVEAGYELPAAKQFRFRVVPEEENKSVYQDAYSPFVLIGHRLDRIYLRFQSDPAKPLGGMLAVERGQVRGAVSARLQIDGFAKPTQSFRMGYSVDIVDVQASPYQNRFRGAIHRAKFAYNITDRMNLRAIIELNTKRFPDSGERTLEAPVSNITFSWEYEPGSFVYVVYYRSDHLERNGLMGNVVPTLYRQSVLLKLNKSLSF